MRVEERLVSMSMISSGILVLFFLMWVYVFISLGYVLRSGIARWNGSSVCNFLRNCQPFWHPGSDWLYHVTPIFS